ncbi:MAG: ABC transporter permease [Phycisphaeraceae bacterium]|nr:ABC transporter permease [Phycisphaeraceae bacterium]
MLLLVQSWTFRRRWWLWVAATVVIALMSWRLVHPPMLVVYSQYREAAAAGKVQFALFTVIPFSPTDRLTDAAIDPRLLSPGWHPTDEEIRSATRDRVWDALRSAMPQWDTPDAEKNPQAAALVQRVMDGVGSKDMPASCDFDRGMPSRELVQLALTPRDTRLHLCGTTAGGEDLASRMIHAARIALTIGFIATGIALVIGVIVGGVMGYFSGWVDLLGMRVVEIFSAIPTIYLLIAIVAFYGRSLLLMMTVIGLTSWEGYAVFIRAEFLRLRQQDFVQAARACGLPLRSILFRHMLPNGIAPALVTASFGVASAILFESTLSFLGLGLIEEPSWGQILNQARVTGTFYWWVGFYPGLAIFLTVSAYNLVGEALRDAIDPHLKKAAQL